MRDGSSTAGLEPTVGTITSLVSPSLRRAPQPAATAAAAVAVAEAPAPPNWLEQCPSSQRATVGWMHFFYGCARYAPWFVRFLEPFMIAGSRWAFVDALRPGPRANAAWLVGPHLKGEPLERFVDEVLRHFYRFIHDVGQAAYQTPEQILAKVESVEGKDHYDAARALGRGAVIATAHLGSFEVGIAALREFEERVHVVFQRDVFAAFEELRDRLHRNLGVINAPVDEGIGVWMSLRDALQRDEVVLMQADRVMPGHRGVRVPFMGGEIEMPTGPVKLAAISGAPILPVFAIRRPGNRIRLVIAPAIHVGPRDGMVGMSEPSGPMLRLAESIEKQVRANPHQWLMLHKVWGDHSPRNAGGSAPEVGA